MLEMIPVPFLLDLLLICLLAATIGFCVLLNRKLSVMRDAQAELHKVAVEFDQAIVRSKLGISQLKTASQTAAEGLQKEVDIAQSLLEEMKLINASSSRIADRLQEGVGGAARSVQQESGPTSDLPEDESTEENSQPNARPRTEAERELLQMLTKSGK